RYLEGITQDDYNRRYNRYSSEKSKYEQKLSRISKADDEYYFTVQTLLNLASRSYELFISSEPEQKRQIIALTLQNLQIRNGKL
ncbi:MAG TPA: hypothetical protein PK957_04645, partial [Candidatus Dojkabacteria bacterium]|nr:hypothetical protein [Candidatus Dojkabacteria bacterium]